MTRGPAEWLGYLETELDPAIQAEVLVESARAEARIAILEILLAIGFGVYFGWASEAFSGIAWFVLLTVVPLLLDAAVRRNAAKQLEGIGPRPPQGIR